MRMKRPLGMSMSEWANQVRESYRRVQRALLCARETAAVKAGPPPGLAPPGGSRAGSEHG